MSDHQKPVTYGHGTYDHSTQSSRQTVKFLTATTIGITLFLLSGLTLTGTVLGLILATPVLVLFSPILVPASVVLFLAAAGLLFSGGSGVAAVTAFSWIYNYVAGMHPAGADKLDYAGAVHGNKARDVKERGKDYGHYMQGRAQDANVQGRAQDANVQAS